MPQVTFTASGALQGARRTFPMVPSLLAWGAVFGILSRQAGLSLSEAVLMSGTVFAGASQLVSMELWRAPLPVLEILLTTLIINLRHVLMGAALYPWFAPLNVMQRYGSAFFITDESWALTLDELEHRSTDAAFLLGSGLTLYLTWLGATVIGQSLGAAIPDPARWGLDFASIAVFLALLVGMWRGKTSLLPWLVAAVVALAASRLLPGKWYILLGGLAGSLVGAWRDVD